MKRAWGLLLFLAMLLLFSAALADMEISEAVFPDEGFRRYVLDAGFDGNGDGRLSKAEIRKVTSIDCHSRGIRSLQGIETFTELTELQCYDNELTEVDVSKNRKLASLGVYGNRLTKLDLSRCKNLVSFSCSGNPVSELVLPDNRKLTWVDLTRTNLQELEIGKYPLLVKLVRAGKPTPYIYGETEDQVNWVSDKGFLAISRQFVLKGNGAVLYDGTGGTDAAAETAKVAETPKTPAESSGKQEQPETPAETGAKQKIARLLKPDYKGGYNTLWMNVPENFTMTYAEYNSTASGEMPYELTDIMAGVRLKSDRKKDSLNISIDFFTSGRWMEYGNLNEVPEDVVKEAAASYMESHPNDPMEMEVYEFSNGLKVLRQVGSMLDNAKYFVGWTMHNGYEIEVNCWIDRHDHWMPPYPGKQDIQIIGRILESLTESDE